MRAATIAEAGCDIRAMAFDDTGGPLRDVEVPDPVPAAGQLLIDVHARGIFRADLDLIDHDLPHPKRPVIPGHEIVGTVKAVGAGVSGFSVGKRVGVPWVGHTCGHCRYARIYATNRVLRGIRSTAVTPSTRSPTAATAFICLSDIRTWKRHHCCAQDSSAIARWPRQAMRSGSASTGLAPPRISSPRSRFIRGVQFMHSRVTTMWRLNSSRCGSVRSGPAAATKRRLTNSMLRYCSRPLVHSCRLP